MWISDNLGDIARLCSQYNRLFPFIEAIPYFHECVYHLCIFNIWRGGDIFKNILPPTFALQQKHRTGEGKWALTGSFSSSEKDLPAHWLHFHKTQVRNLFQCQMILSFPPHHLSKNISLLGKSNIASMDHHLFKHVKRDVTKPGAVTTF